ncbi:MAG: hypothetical protein DRH50_12100 [Deltaproteobacteria bacterium]|nr:MAG: hypothetical protein DRH50_12100 [Deltaproteobacteria bacterium]
MACQCQSQQQEHLIAIHRLAEQADLLKRKDPLVIFDLNPASVESAEDLPVPARQTGARRQGRRRTPTLQVLANTADSVKSTLRKR